MALSIAVDITGSPEGNDVEAATLAVESYNEANGTTLPTRPLGQLATSYETVQAALLTAAHADYARQAADKALEADVKTLWRNATDQQRAAAVAALGG